MVSFQNFGFPVILCSQRTVTAAGMATEFLFVRLAFAIASRFAATSASAGVRLCYHAANFTQNS